jgi:putative transposase
VTLRAREALPSLRSTRVFPTLQRSLAASHKAEFRVVHFSVQSDHVHLVVEGDTSLALVRGIQGLACRCAKAVNRVAGAAGASGAAVITLTRSARPPKRDGDSSTSY